MNEIFVAAVGGAAGTLLAGIIAYWFKKDSIKTFLLNNAWNVGLTIATCAIGSVLLFQDSRPPTVEGLPVGTVLVSSLDGAQFLRPDGGVDRIGTWVPANGRALPSGTEYARLTGSNFAPDYRSLSESKILLDIVQGQADSGTSISSLRNASLSDAEWSFHFGLRNIEGQQRNGDYEYTRDNFQIIPDDDIVTAQGRTYNEKPENRGWAPWRPGSVNYLGLAIEEVEIYYYVRVD